MAILPTRSLSAIVSTISAGVQGRARSLVDFSVGSTLLAIAEGFGSVALWMQSLILRLLLVTRASTSSAADLDTWVGDYGVIRIGSVAATGLVTVSRFTAGTTTPFVPVGAQLKTYDSTQIFTVTASASLPNFSSALGGYTLAAGASSMTVSVQAVTSGAAGNVSPGSLSQISSSLPGIDTVTNSAAITGGSDSESDDNLRARFVLYIGSLSKATQAAIGYAIKSLQLSLFYTITEITDFNGTRSPGFAVVVDDGSGAPPVAVVNTARAAVNSVRAAGVMFSVQGPILVSVTVSMHIVVSSAYSLTTLQATVTAAVTSYINSLGLGNSLVWSRLIQVAYDASPGITSVSSLMINGGVADITATAGQTIKCTGVVIS